MASKQRDFRSSHIQDVVTHALKRAKAPEKARIEEFVGQYYRSVSTDDLLERSPADLAGAALAHYEFAAKRTPGKPLIRVYNPDEKRDGWASTHTVVEMVNDDMPFLVDSMGMVLNRNGHSLILTVHPIVQVKRNKQGRLTEILAADSDDDSLMRESFLHVEVDRETDPEHLANLAAEIESVMADVRASVRDWSEMRDKAVKLRDQLPDLKLPLKKREINEGSEFLSWLVNNHFTFLGYREYDLVKQDGEDVLRMVPDSGMGILAPRERKGLTRSYHVLPKDVRKRARAKELLIITKANSIATVHRPSYMDYIGIKRFDEDGNVSGEMRFLGLFTSSAYSRSSRDIPLLRSKVEEVMKRSGLPRDSHGGKALLHILETIPRDELFQISVDELFETAMGVLQLQERQRVKLFVRRDSFGRFFSCLAYVPRDRYNTQVRLKVEQILHEALGGSHSESHGDLSESALAQIHVVVRTTPWRLPEYDIEDLEERIRRAVRSWHDELRDSLIARIGEEAGLDLYRRYAEYMPAAYIEDVTPDAAVFDLEKMDALADDETLRMSLYRPTGSPRGLWRFKVFHREQPLPISDALPMLENMGVKVISERPYEIDLNDGTIIWVQDFEMIYSGDDSIEPADVRAIFQDVFASVWSNEIENDGFNRLVMGARLDWRQISLLRAYCKYLLQTGIPFSQTYMEDALVSNAEIARQLVELFEMRFEPGRKQREVAADKIATSIRSALDQVTSLDDDRILRGYLNVILATLRTNYYQTDADGELKPYMSFKFDPAKIPELPLPRPAYEIFVYSPRVEGVHLRGGRVARGGLRWSDRREDFRTEVLGLMKAQQVKNAVIVPVGAKGGFFVKQPPTHGGREALMNEGIACYKTFISGLLDLTDNIVNNKILPPRDVIRHDGDDSYLVVAADKGTATFSDIANGVAQDYGFWLGDAFASGGSVGYDHKKMGITAKGAWESVKRHFRELGTDIQSTNFSAVGIGDMSGDVFGNGMLLSRHIKLKAAFDHRHIFLDPFPDPETSYAERERLFNLPRSSWEDYNPELISKGGGVYPRTAKSIKLTQEVREVLGVEETSMTPNELMRAILKAPVDLLWNGGIGTYVRSSRESNTEVGDRANDAIRVTGADLRCRVVGEGGNLGLTQLGRIEYALKGGRMNTDFIDNSAGVDCSDHEVNIKILLNLVDPQSLSEKQRTQLLAKMTDEVSELVLRDNYMQAQALSITEATAALRINEHGYVMRGLERSAGLNRSLEFLPNEEELAERRAGGKGLTRPELSVLLAYCKIDIYRELVDSDVPEDTYLARELENYFPTPLRKRYAELMPKHRLRREIVATAITNSLVNRMGPTFCERMRDETGASTPAVARAYTIAREVYGIRDVWAAIEALDNKVPASLQIGMMVQTGRLVRHATRWLLERSRRQLDIAETVDDFAPGVRELFDNLSNVMGPLEATQYEEEVARTMEAGVHESLARYMSAIKPLYAALDIVSVAQETKRGVTDVAAAYFHLETELELGWLREQIESLPVEGHWQAIARGTLRDNLYVHQRRLTALALKRRSKVKENAAPDALVNDWLGRRRERIQHALRVFSEMRTAGSVDFATASVALQEVRKLN